MRGWLIIGICLFFTIGCNHASIKFDTEGTKISNPTTLIEKKMTDWNNE